uniref:hypothetical protein n=1 Tax=Bacillus multifaciens TaxID=3068506 RepID=UPI003F4921C5
MAIHLNGKQFILDKTSVAELFFLMDQERIECFFRNIWTKSTGFCERIKKG